MTTFVRSPRNDNVLIGFALIVVVAVAIRVESTGGRVAAGVLALGVIGFWVWLRRRPPHEIRVSPTEIVYVANGRVTDRIGHVEAGGRVRVHKRIHRGHAYFSLVDADMSTGAGIPLDDFRIPNDGLAAACTEHGWQLVS